MNETQQDQYLQAQKLIAEENGKKLVIFWKIL